MGRAKPRHGGWRDSMRSWKISAAACGLLVLAGSSSATAQGSAGGRRVALVVGNDAYQAQGALANAVNDARAVANALTEVGFSVTKLEDTTRSQLTNALGDSCAVVARRRGAVLLCGAWRAGGSGELPSPDRLRGADRDGIAAGCGSPARARRSTPLPRPAASCSASFAALARVRAGADPRTHRGWAQGRTGPRTQGRQEVRAVESPSAAGSGRDGPPRHVGVRTVPRTRHQAGDALQVRRTPGPVA